MPAKGQTSWTPEQEQFLRDNYGKLTMQEIADHIGKPVGAIDPRRRRMGIKPIGLGNRMKQLASEGKHPMHRPEVVEKFKGENNPSCRPEVKEKLSELRRREYAEGTNKCGWKGPQRVPTETERKIMGPMYAMGFTWNDPIATGKSSRSKEPNHYSLDFGHFDLKICVEIDGSSHRGNRQKARDERKDEFLRSKGWIVMRFSNDEVLNDPVSIVKQIREVVATRHV